MIDLLFYSHSQTFARVGYCPSEAPLKYGPARYSFKYFKYLYNVSYLYLICMIIYYIPI